MKMKTRFGVAADWPFDYGALEPYYVEADACACALAARDSIHRIPANGDLVNREARAEIWY